MIMYIIIIIFVFTLAHFIFNRIEENKCIKKLMKFDLTVDDIIMYESRYDKNIVITGKIIDFIENSRSIPTKIIIKNIDFNNTKNVIINASQVVRKNTRR